jgi:hypothetical protein
MSSSASPSRWKGRYQKLLLRRRGQDPLADARQRRSEYQRPHQVRALTSHGLRHQAAEVMPAKDRPVQPELLDQPDDAARLRAGRLPAGGAF